MKSAKFPLTCSAFPSAAFRPTKQPSSATMIAFTAIGRFDDLDQAAASMVHIKDKFEPNMEVHKIYDRIYNEIFVKIFDKLKPLYNISREMEENNVTSV